MSSESRSKRYYDEFSTTYERARHHGYHAMIDDLEVAVAADYCRGRLLEAGCGTGLILRRLSPLCRDAFGIDLSSGMLVRARARGLPVAQASVDALPFPDATFDVVVSFKVLAHVPGIEAALAELARVTRPGGNLVLELYNRRSLRGLIKRLKRPTPISDELHDEDVFTRFDTLEDIRRYLPAGVKLRAVRGVRVLTPFARLHDVPFLGRALRLAERQAANVPLLQRFAGFMIVILERE